jgi:hypothetical protein
LSFETDKQIVYLTTDEKKKGDETYRLSNKTIVLRGDSTNPIRFADVRAGDRISIELDETKSGVREIVVLKNRLVTANPKRIEMNKRSFKIPFQIGLPAGHGIKRIALHVSTDEGRTWALEQVRILADVDREFSVTVPKDGLYWFAVQAESKDGVVVPNVSGFQPDLRVRVDTTKAAK